MKEDMLWGSVTPDNKYYKKGLANKLTSICYDNFNGESGEIDLIVSVLISGAKIDPVSKKRDHEFLASELFEKYCEMLGLNHLYVLQLISKITDYYDYGVEFDFSLLDTIDEEGENLVSIN